MTFGLLTFEPPAEMSTAISPADDGSVEIAVGSLFTSFSELEKVINKYQKKHYVQFYKRDSRTTEAASKRCVNKTFNPAIKYSELVYTCIHGGKKFKSESKGKRPQQQ